MVSIDDVIAYGLTLPRSTEGVVRGRRKLYIGRIVYVAHEAEGILGFAHPKEFREALVETDPEKFLLPVHQGDMRWNWACVRMDRIDGAEMRELVLDAWAFCVPKTVAREYAKTLNLR
ncbi:MAG TPA: hypothetical protein VFM58_12795 [Solirubrobacteraceae bacterium]|nr:hypothetical protein [Solirubrobacteraceae bacterium]